ncbi:MAG: hypothetical protein IPH08_04935 [Rhodocyclaceae bacterium]|nr:hypothetical protein [Rhodocyclaceae bacterium]
MSIGIRTIFKNSVKPISTGALIVRRLQNKVKGLGYWAAHDFARKNIQSEPPR